MTGNANEQEVKSAADRAIHVLLAVVFTAVGIGAIAGIAMLVTGDDGDFGGRVMLTAGTVAGYTLASLAAGLVIRRGRLIVLMWGAIAMCFVTIVVWTILIWMGRHLDMEQQEFLGRLGGTTTVAAIGLLYTAVYAMMKTRSGVLGVIRWGVVGMAMLFALLLIILFWFAESLERYLPPAVLMTIATGTMALGAGAAVGSLLVRVMFRLNERREKSAAESVLDRPRLELACPQCHAEQRLATGPVRCGVCGFTMVIEVEEPRCACGYLLFRLDGDRCPECGRAI